jgi:hypothetical protein
MTTMAYARKRAWGEKNLEWPSSRTTLNIPSG